MITCDRCQKQIEVTLYQQAFERVPDDLGNCLIACLDCSIAFRDGVEQIRSEVKAEKNSRIRNWLKEWQSNKDLR